MRFMALLLSSLFLLPSVLVAADNPIYETMSVDEVARILSTKGFTANKEKSTKGEPYLKSSVSNYNFDVYLYYCDGDRSCQDVQFVLALKNVSGSSLERMNDWNAKIRMTKAFLDGKDPVLEMDIPIKGGVTKAHLEYYIHVWGALAPKFAEFLSSGSL